MILQLFFAFAVLIANATAGITWPWPWQCFGLHSRTKPSWRDLVVDATGNYPGSFKNISSAVSALKNTTAYDQTIFIFPGIYVEQVYIGKFLGPLTIQGYTCDTRSYINNQVTISYNLSRLTPGLTSNDQTSTIRLWSSNVRFYNLNIANSFGKGSQALALSAQNTNQGFYGCNFTGWQDTIYANEGRQIYAKSYINGAVDFIFGLRAAAWFHDNDIETLGTGWVTANGREAANNTSFYVFNKCSVTGVGGAASTYLGRPWRQFSRVVFQRTYLGDVVNPAGWARWDAVQPVENLYYREYDNSGPGAIGPRANFSALLEKPVKVADILGKHFEQEYWVDPAYLT
ncbi:Pectinesterase [Dactylella cylindrospora]|nr:Pectinesterase [Dactylella cylindrospora]